MSRKPDVGVARDVVVPFRLTRSETDLLDGAVKRVGTSRSDFLRTVVLDAVFEIVLETMGLALTDDEDPPPAG